MLISSDWWVRAAKVRHRVQAWIFSPFTHTGADDAEKDDTLDSDGLEMGWDISEAFVVGWIIIGKLKQQVLRGRHWEYLHEKWLQLSPRSSAEAHLHEKWSQLFRRSRNYQTWSQLSRRSRRHEKWLQLLQSAASLLVHGVWDSQMNYCWQKKWRVKSFNKNSDIFRRASNLILGHVPIKAAIEHHKTHKLQFSDDIPFQVFHFWTTSFDAQAKKGGFHAWAQFEFSRCWPGVVNMCPLSWPPCIGSSW